MPQPLRLATRSPNKLIKLCIGVAFVTPNRLPTGMPYRHPSTPKHNQGPKLERHWIRQSLSSAVSYIQDAADACRNRIYAQDSTEGICDGGDGLRGLRARRFGHKEVAR